MKNIFAKFQDYVKKPNRNTFDLSFYNNLTLKFGQLTPVFCKEVIPGDSFKIDTAFGLQLMPMKFPVQTPMKAYIHYFYVRNRTLWKDWMDFIGGTKENLVQPYISALNKKEFFRVGGLADYFGVPNVMYSSESESLKYELPVVGASQSLNYDLTDSANDGVISYSALQSTRWVAYQFAHYMTLTEYLAFIGSTAGAQTYVDNMANNIIGLDSEPYHVNLNPNYLPNPYDGIAELNNDLTQSTFRAQSRYIPWFYVGSFGSNVSNISLYLSSLLNEDYHTSTKYQYIKMPFIFIGRDVDGVIRNVSYQTLTPVLTGNSTVYNTKTYYEKQYNVVRNLLNDEGIVKFDVLCPLLPFIDYSNSGNITNIYSGSILPNSVVSLKWASGNVNDLFSIVGDGVLSTTPYDSDIHLNALPFRAYEAIYNAYYRNPQNNPFILNGVPEYNRYNTTYDGGADTTSYDLFYRNWEYDFLTSAVQSPQQGTAPLVGISVTGEATFQDEDGNTYYAQAILNDQGEITGWQSHSSNMPTGSLRLLMDMAGSGISINDLRNVNAFQRFLENNIRRGLKYRDQLMSHFGVKARYDELDMPEFIGGCSTSINVNKLSQTSESGDTPLGSFVGQASAFGQSKHSVTHYCDEHGFIIGIMSVVPVPVYSQLLPKFFVKSQQLDYYFPEFGHIGYQPILQKEVSPLQTYYNGNDLNTVFGYNRAWYDYLASTDEVHGQFRTTMRDFLMNRTFESEPELSEDFLLVDPDQLNDVFLAGTDDDDLYAPDSDKIIGSIYFSVSAKRPIPLFGIPKLTD